MTLLNQRLHKPEEERKQKGPDMGTVHIRIRHDNDFAVPQLGKVKLCLLYTSFLLFSITACTPNSAGSSSGSPTELLNYPGLTWDMSPQEVTSALHLREDQIQTRDDEPSFALGYVPEGEIFGLKPANIVFEFLNIDSEQKLYNVTVTYPEGRCV